MGLLTVAMHIHMHMHGVTSTHDTNATSMREIDPDTSSEPNFTLLQNLSLNKMHENITVIHICNLS